MASDPKTCIHCGRKMDRRTRAYTFVNGHGYWHHPHCPTPTAKESTMDPTAALRDFALARARAISAGNQTNPDAELHNLREAVEAANDLFEWLAKGGANPRWSLVDEGFPSSRRPA